MDEGIRVADIVSVEEEIENRETVKKLYAALNELDDLSRQIIELLYFGEHTEREVAVIVGLSQNGKQRHLLNFEIFSNLFENNAFK